MPFVLNGTTIPNPDEYEIHPIKPYIRGDTQGGVRQFTHMTKVYRQIRLRFTALSRAQRETLYALLLVAMENSVFFEDHRGTTWTVISPNARTGNAAKTQGYSSGVGPVLYDMEIDLLGWS